MLSRSRGRCGDVDSPDIRMMRKLFDIVDTRPKCTALIALTRGFSRCSSSTGFLCQYYPKRKVCPHWRKLLHTDTAQYARRSLNGLSKFATCLRFTVVIQKPFPHPHLFLFCR